MLPSRARTRIADSSQDGLLGGPSHQASPQRRPRTGRRAGPPAPPAGAERPPPRRHRRAALVDHSRHGPSVPGGVPRADRRRLLPRPRRRAVPRRAADGARCGEALRLLPRHAGAPGLGHRAGRGRLGRRAYALPRGRARQAGPSPRRPTAPRPGRPAHARHRNGRGPRLARVRRRHRRPHVRGVGGEVPRRARRAVRDAPRRRRHRHAEEGDEHAHRRHAVRARRDDGTGRRPEPRRRGPPSPPRSCRGRRRPPHRHIRPLRRQLHRPATRWARTRGRGGRRHRRHRRLDQDDGGPGLSISPRRACAGRSCSWGARRATTRRTVVGGALGSQRRVAARPAPAGRPAPHVTDLESFVPQLVRQGRLPQQAAYEDPAGSTRGGRRSSSGRTSRPSSTTGCAARMTGFRTDPRSPSYGEPPGLGRPLSPGTSPLLA